MKLTENNLLVSVCMITYNHEKYISMAIESVLNQQTNFDVEIIISDDCSTDKTRDICISYRNQFPNKIKLINPEKNLGVIKNSIQSLSACNGKYIAICEGDDYWIDPFKLQKQVNFLEKNSDYSIIHTNYSVVNESNEVISTFKRLSDKYHNSSEIFSLYMERKYEIASLTAVFKSKLFFDFKGELCQLDLKMTDLPMWLEFSKLGKVKYLNEVTACYRVLQNSASHFDDLNKNLEFRLNTLSVFKYFGKKYNYPLKYKRTLSKYFGNLVKISFERSNSEMASDFYIKMIGANVLSIFNFRPLLFLLATKMKVFRLIIYSLKRSRFWFIKKHFI
jgi:glycosyltransferase involved in cell wall biosynthesis